MSYAEITFRDSEFCQDIRGVASGTVDGVLCLEVFEHLPPAETADALQSIHDLLKPEGIVENVVGSFLMRPPEDRPIAEIAPGLRFHHDHMGFDFRRFRDTLASRFRLRQVSAGPFEAPGSGLMPEVNFVAQKRVPAG